MSDTGFVDVNGGRLYYEVAGEGHPLLLIHGGLGSLRMWDEQVPVFAERYRVVRYDTRGFGRSETDAVELSEVAGVAAVLDNVGAASGSVVGQSRGGGFGLDLTIAHPERVDAFVSVAGGVGGHEGQRPDGMEPPPFDEMERLWSSKDWDKLSELETRVWVDGWGQPTTRVDPTLREKVHGWILTTYRAEQAEGKPRGLAPPAAGRLGGVRVPVLVMIGEADEPGGVAAGRHLAASVPGARLVTFPGVAHMIQLECPQRFNELVLAFLAEADERRNITAGGKQPRV
ncbi:alpha/beta hydrolase [soil metagenome]